MSTETKVICERGKFFIETGTPHSFFKFVENSSNAIYRYIHPIFIVRIGALIDQGDRDNAILLWTNVCALAEGEPVRRRRATLLWLYKFAMGLAFWFILIKIINY